MYFTLRKGFNNFSAVFFVWIKSKGKEYEWIWWITTCLGHRTKLIWLLQKQKIGKSYEWKSWWRLGKKVSLPSCSLKLWEPWVWAPLLTWTGACRTRKWGTPSLNRRKKDSEWLSDTGRGPSSWTEANSSLIQWGLELVRLYRIMLNPDIFSQGNVTQQDWSRFPIPRTSHSASLPMMSKWGPGCGKTLGILAQGNLHGGLHMAEPSPLGTHCQTFTGISTLTL